MWKREGGSEREKAGKGGCSHLDLLHFHWWGVERGWGVKKRREGGSAPHMDQYVDLLEGREVVMVEQQLFFFSLDPPFCCFVCRYIAVKVPEKPNKVRELSRSLFKKEVRQKNVFKKGYFTNFFTGGS